MHDLGFLSVRIQLGNSLGFQQREFNEGFGHIGDERTQQPNRGWGGGNPENSNNSTLLSPSCQRDRGRNGFPYPKIWGSLNHGGRSCGS